MEKTIISIDVDQEIKERARANSDFCIKESEKRGVAPVFLRKDAFYIGFLGEMAARRHFGLPLVEKEYLDFGWDLDVGGKKVDVKTSVTHKSLERPIRDGFRFLVSTAEKLDNVDVILFAKLEPDLSKVHLMGWINRAELNEFPVVKYGKMSTPAHLIFYAYLKDLKNFEF